MNVRAQIRMLSDGRRLHMQDGPIDLIVQAFGEEREIESAYHAAAGRFATVLDELCSELAFLRQPAMVDGPQPKGSVARRMVNAVRPYASANFITPMAAVAGAVAEEILGAVTSAAQLSRAYVNDGGDIALYLTPSEKFVVGMVQFPDRPPNPTFRKSRNVGRPLFTTTFGTTTIDFAQPIRGIATSGWRGRSFSLGIADAVTVLAGTAAMADAAATIIGNAVDLPGNDKIGRERACDLAPDSDLGERLVTQSVGQLSSHEICEALAAGGRVAESLRHIGLIRAAALSLQGEIRVVGAATGAHSITTSSSNRSLAHA
ncbi:MAG: UPF0280 family protein [Acidobacteriia bacterium]|nr:UPF0280 family protein [Terriglobia bacterium]